MIHQPVQPATGETTMNTTTDSSSSLPTIYIDTQHDDLIHDTQLDFYGSKLATCSSGMFVYIFICAYYCLWCILLF
jgi:hypothetical protein